MLLSYTSEFHQFFQPVRSDDLLALDQTFAAKYIAGDEYLDTHPTHSLITLQIVPNHNNLLNNDSNNNSSNNQKEDQNHEGFSKVMKNRVEKYIQSSRKFKNNIPLMKCFEELTDGGSTLTWYLCSFPFNSQIPSETNNMAMIKEIFLNSKNDGGDLMSLERFLESRYSLVNDYQLLRGIFKDLARSLFELHFMAKLSHNSVIPRNVVISKKSVKALIGLPSFGLDDVVGTLNDEHLTYFSPQVLERFENGEKNVFSTSNDVYMLGTLIIRILLGEEFDAKYLDTERMDEELKELKTKILNQLGNEIGALGEMYGNIVDTAFKCINRDESKRPTISEILQQFEKPVSIISPPNRMLSSWTTTTNRVSNSSETKKEKGGIFSFFGRRKGSEATDSFTDSRMMNDDITLETETCSTSYSPASPTNSANITTTTTTVPNLFVKKKRSVRVANSNIILLRDFEENNQVNELAIVPKSPISTTEVDTESKKEAEELPEDLSEEKKKQYIIDKRISEGASAVVFTLKKPSECVMKRYKKGHESDYKREIRCLQNRHQNIVTLVDNYSFKEGDNYNYAIIMEYCGYGDLYRLVSSTVQKSAIKPIKFLTMCIQLFEALCHIHSNEYVHCDVKPQNVFLQKDGTVKLGDFAFSVRNGETSPGLTFHYAPPELHEGKPAIIECDVYSAACSLFEVLVKKKISLKDKDFTQVWDQHNSNNRFYSRTLANPHANALFNLMKECLEPDVKNRCSSRKALSGMIEIRNNYCSTLIQKVFRGFRLRKSLKKKKQLSNPTND